MSAPAQPAPRAPDPGFAVEPTPIGLQSLVPGITPIGIAQRLAARAAAPLEPRKPQRPCDLGLFDLNARLQLDLFQPAQPASVAGEPLLGVADAEHRPRRARGDTPLVRGAARPDPDELPPPMVGDG